MSNENSIRAGLREMFTAVKNAITSQWPESELPLIRHTPLDDDSDACFWSDMRYMHDLKLAILEELREGAFLWELPVPVEGQEFWKSWDWEIDEAALLIDAWKYGEAAA